MRPTSPFIIRILFAGVALFLVSCSPDEEGDPQYYEPPPFFDGKDGSRCVSNVDCLGGTCISEIAGWREGYCTTIGCDMRDCNGEDAICLNLLDNTQSCFDGCDIDDDCRPGYYCATKDGKKFCSARFEDGPVQGETGASCESDDDCNRDLACELGLKGGYCLSRGCVTCIGDGVCLDYPGVGEACVDGCTETTDCRNGYLCKPFGEENICTPADDPPPIIPFETTAQVLGITCGATSVGEGPTGKRWEMDFEVPPGFESYVVVPLAPEGLISPLEISGAASIDLIDTYRHHNLRATEYNLYDAKPLGRYAEFAFDWPIMVPYAPQYVGLRADGSHTMRLTTTSSEPCVYVIGGNEGQTLDLNIYLVGIEGLDADAARASADLAEVLATVDQIYGQVGIELGSVKFYNATEEARERFGIVRSLADIKRVTAMGEPRDPTLAGHLSIDVFLVEDILVNGGNTKILGISAGLPGAPGMHGNAGNGLVFGVSDLGTDNPFVGYIMAHEIAHYLGLRHTTELLNGTGTDGEAQYNDLVGLTDPIMDTEVCSSPLRRGSSCPDFNNLLFPAAPPAGATVNPDLSPGQGFVMRINPLVR